MKYIVALLIALLAVGAAIGLYSTSPQTKKARPVRPVPLVQTDEIKPGRERVSVEAFGTVIPARRITLQSEVEGRIIRQHTNLVPGGLITRGEVVVQIDPTEYKLTVNQYRAELEEALFELELEQGKQVIAQREWKLMEEEITTSEEGKSLALREPHLRLVQAKVDKAKSLLAAAELALDRTTITAPFNALVLEEFVDRGQLVGKQSALATLAGTDLFWVQVSVPVSVLHRISFTGESGMNGSAAEVVFEPVSGRPIVRRGNVLNMMGDLDPEGRMARLLVVIRDPLNLHGNSHIQEERSRILLGSYVKVRIDAGFFDDVYSIPRQALREGDVLWVKDKDETFQIRTVTVVWRRKDDVLVRTDMKQGDALILSRLQSPLPGMMLKNVEK